MTCKLKSVRTAQSMTQGELAEAAGITRQTVINIESSKSIPTVETALKIAKVLNTTVEEIFSLRGGRRKK